MHQVKIVLLGLVSCLFCAPAARAAVVLSTNATIPYYVANPGQSFTVTVYVNNTFISGSPTELVTGVNFYLIASAQDRFKITARDISASALASVLNTDNGNTSGSGQLFDPVAPAHFTTLDDALDPAGLNPPKQYADLGGSPASSLNTGVYEIAKFTIQVLPGTPNGLYTISTVSPSGIGWSDAAFGDHEFLQNDNVTTGHTTFQVLVPEPSVLGLGLVGMILCARRTRR